jgi:hypothetical protein
MTTGYWLSKLMYDLQDPKLREAYRADPAPVLARYRLDDVVVRALANDDITVLAPRVNAYLLRFYYQYSGIGDADFMAGLRGLAKKDEAHG